MSPALKRAARKQAQTAAVADGSAMDPKALSLAVNDTHNHAIRLGHGVARQGNSLECWRCGMSCTVSDVNGKAVSLGSLHMKACPK